MYEYDWIPYMNMYLLFHVHQSFCSSGCLLLFNGHGVCWGMVWFKWEM